MIKQFYNILILLNSKYELNKLNFIDVGALGFTGIGLTYGEVPIWGTDGWTAQRFLGNDGIIIDSLTSGGVSFSLEPLYASQEVVGSINSPLEIPVLTIDKYGRVTAKSDGNLNLYNVFNGFTGYVTPILQQYFVNGSTFFEGNYISSDFTNNEIIHIFNKYLNVNLHPLLIKNNCRNIIFAIFICQTYIYEPSLITEDFCNFNYPPIVSFANSNYTLNDIRQLSYKYCQYNLSIKDLTLDLLKISKKKYQLIIEESVKIEHLLNYSNKGREPIYIEALLCLLFI